MKSYFIFTDVHGCRKTLEKLLTHCPYDRQPFSLGDNIDRGPDSAGVVDLLIERKIPSLVGNHEDMMLDALLRRNAYQPRIWEYNGGDRALKSWGGKVPERVIEWAHSLRESHAYFGMDEFGQGGHLLLSHTGYGGLFEGRIATLWTRHGHDGPEFPADGRFRVFGHTPQATPEITEGYAMIDTGCAYAARNPRFGTLTAFLWPEKVVIQERCIDDV